MTESVDQRFPHLARWLNSYGWVEIGQDHYSRSFIRVLDEGGMVWEGATKYESLNDALHAAEEALTQWMWQELGER